MITIRFTEEEEARLFELSQTERMAIMAVRQAMFDLGIPVHTNGQCPESPCPCTIVGDDALEARTSEILGLTA